MFLHDETLNRTARTDDGREFASLSHGHRLVIWIAFGGDERVWFPGPLADAALCERAKGYGELGLWKLSRYDQLEKAIRLFSPDLVETDGQLKPYMCQQIMGKNEETET